LSIKQDYCINNTNCKIVTPQKYYFFSKYKSAGNNFSLAGGGSIGQFVVKAAIRKHAAGISCLFL
jgi:hypothetical protein